MQVPRTFVCAIPAEVPHLDYRRQKDRRRQITKLKGTGCKPARLARISHNRRRLDFPRNAPEHGLGSLCRRLGLFANSKISPPRSWELSWVWPATKSPALHSPLHPEI